MRHKGGLLGFFYSIHTRNVWHLLTGDVVGLHVSRQDQAGSKKRRQQPITGFLQPITNTGKMTASTGKRKPAGPGSQAPCVKKSRKGENERKEPNRRIVEGEGSGADLAAAFPGGAYSCQFELPASAADRLTIAGLYPPADSVPDNIDYIKGTRRRWIDERVTQCNSVSGCSYPLIGSFSHSFTKLGFKCVMANDPCLFFFFWCVFFFELFFYGLLVSL